MLQSEINKLIGTTVEIVVTHGDDMVCRMVGKLIQDDDGLRVENRFLNDQDSVIKSFVWLDKRKCVVGSRAGIPLICYNM